MFAVKEVDFLTLKNSQKLKVSYAGFPEMLENCLKDCEESENRSNFLVLGTSALIQKLGRARAGCSSSNPVSTKRHAIYSWPSSSHLMRSSRTTWLQSCWRPQRRSSRTGFLCGEWRMCWASVCGSSNKWILSWMPCGHNAIRWRMSLAYSLPRNAPNTRLPNWTKLARPRGRPRTSSRNSDNASPLKYSRLASRKMTWPRDWPNHAKECQCCKASSEIRRCKSPAFNRRVPKVRERQRPCGPKTANFLRGVSRTRRQLLS